MSKEIGKKIKELRLSKGISRKKVAEDLGISYSAYANYENGYRDISPDFLVEIMDYFDTPVNTFIFEDQTKYKQITRLLAYARLLGAEYKINTEQEPEAIATHQEVEDWTPEELEEIERFKEFVRSKRNTTKDE